MFSGVAVVYHRVLQQVLYIFAPTQSQFIKLSHLQFNRPSLAFAFRLYKTIARHDTFFFFGLNPVRAFWDFLQPKSFLNLIGRPSSLKLPAASAKLKKGNNFISLIIKVLELSSNLTMYSIEQETYHIHINGRPLRQFSYQTQEVHTYMFQDLPWLNFQHEDKRFLSFVDRNLGVRTR